MSTRPLAAGEDSGEWEQQTTRKQRKKQAAAAAPAQPQQQQASAASSSSASAPSAAASSGDAEGDADADGGEEDSSMFSDFMEAGFIGLDGQQIPKGATLITPPPQPAAPAPAPAAAASTAGASSSAGAPAGGQRGVSVSTGGAVGRRPRYQFDDAQLPTCFLCQVRHDIGQCRRKEKI